MATARADHCGREGQPLAEAGAALLVTQRPFQITSRSLLPGSRAMLAGDLGRQERTPAPASTSCRDRAIFAPVKSSGRGAADHEELNPSPRPGNGGTVACNLYPSGIAGRGDSKPSPAATGGAARCAVADQATFVATSSELAPPNPRPQTQRRCNCAGRREHSSEVVRTG